MSAVILPTLPPPQASLRDPSNRIGCIGAGFIMTDCHLPAYRQAGLNPVAIASASEASAQRAAARHQLRACSNVAELLQDESITVLDIAVPPDQQRRLIEQICQTKHIRGILAQKPLGINFAEAVAIVRTCEQAGITLAVNQNMRHDQSVRSCHQLLTDGLLGEPVFATLDMRAIPHWMPWQQRLGWVTLRIMSIHHLDLFRFWFGTPERVFASVRSDPRTAAQFAHTDGICSYILEYSSGLRACSWDDVWSGPCREGAASDRNGINWRVEGTTGLALGTIGWPDYPARTPSTLDYSLIQSGPIWHQPRWDSVWFPDAFAGPLIDLLRSLEQNTLPEISGQDHLETMALVEACYLSAQSHRAVEIAEVMADA